MYFLGGWRKKCIFFKCDISDLCYKNNLGPNPDPRAKIPDLDLMNFDPIKVCTGENKSSFQKSIAECGFI
jgi:hypothetical protein